MKRVPRWLIAAVLVAGCHGTPPTHSAQTAPVPVRAPIKFRFVTLDAGIDFRLGHGGRSPLTILDTAGGGCAFLDFDNDGWPDILLVGPQNVRLYHNEHNGKFTDVTVGCGLKRDGWWMGCTVGDYDGDGRPDIFLTGYHCFALYRNLGGGHFQDVTRESGLTGLQWSMSAAFADLTGSGRLDLYVSQYVRFGSTTPQLCTVGAMKSACGPEVYAALSGMLFRNIDGRHFERVPWHDTGKTWGVLASDLFGSGHPSLYLANDMAPGDLWERKGSRWTNRGTDSGTAYDAQGQRQGGMAVDSGDYDNDGRLDLLVTTYYSQPAGLYHNDGGGLFTVTSNPTGLGPPTMPYVKFGGGFADFNNDGWLDILIASGHVRDNVSRFDPAEGYRQPIQLFLNQSARFTECSAGAGIAGIRAVARGVAFGDYNRDGREDVLICNLEGKAMLLENISDSNNHWLEVRLAESGMNRFALGATVTLTAGSVHQLREIRTCGSVLSAREPVAHFGLGGQTGPCTLEIRWPNGRRQSAAVHRVDQSVTISYAPRFAGGGFAGGGFAGVNAEANGREPR